MRFATRMLEDREPVREARREGRQDTSGRATRVAQRPRFGCAGSRFVRRSCDALRDAGFWKSAVGQRGTPRGSPDTSGRATRVARRSGRRIHELLRLASFLRRFATGDFGDRESVREERREGRQERRDAAESRTSGEVAPRPRLGSRRPRVGAVISVRPRRGVRSSIKGTGS